MDEEKNIEDEEIVEINDSEETIQKEIQEVITENKEEVIENKNQEVTTENKEEVIENEKQEDIKEEVENNIDSDKTIEFKMTEEISDNNIETQNTALESADNNDENDGFVSGELPSREKTREEALNNVKIKRNNKKKKVIIIILVIVILLAAGFLAWKFLFNKTEKKVEKHTVSEGYRISGNDLDKFDLYFLQLENEEKNKIYSPLSIKYALAMLQEGAEGETKTQIDNILGDYKSKKYTDSEYLSLANALFVKEDFKVNKSYTEKLKEKFNADVISDSFKTPDTINSWVSKKTFNLINNVFSDVSDLNYALVNALAIDQEWVNKIQPHNTRSYSVRYPHETTNESYSINKETGKKINYTYYNSVPDLAYGYHVLTFDNKLDKTNTLEIAADINKYDIVGKLGKDNIRNHVDSEYRKWLKNDCLSMYGYGYEDSDQCAYKDDFMDKYMKELSENYNKIDSSTDFSFYVDNDIKVFAKDLKEYDGTTLEYIGIMPTNQKLTDYISKTDPEKINKIIDSLKPIELSSFKDGYITKITGYIPIFNFDYELALKDDLKKLGIKDVFDSSKANLSKIVSGSYIEKAVHKTNIDFSNDGIKASSVTAIGGAGATGGYFDYLYDVPIEIIDLTFDKPYMFIIRDKASGEVWFTGTVYEPTQCNDNSLHKDTYNNNINCRIVTD